MRDIPARVVYVMSAEVGLMIGLGIITYHSFKAVITATKREAWRGFRSL